MQAVMQGVSAHMRQGASNGETMGVPAASRKRESAIRIAPCGQAVMQSPQRVQADRNSGSGKAPGGRSRGMTFAGRSAAGGAADKWGERRKNPPRKKSRLDAALIQVYRVVGNAGRPNSPATAKLNPS